MAVTCCDWHPVAFVPEASGEKRTALDRRGVENRQRAAPGIHLVDIDVGVWRIRLQKTGDVRNGFGLRADQDDAVRRHVPAKSCTGPQIGCG